MMNIMKNFEGMQDLHMEGETIKRIEDIIYEETEYDNILFDQFQQKLEIMDIDLEEEDKNLNVTIDQAVVDYTNGVDEAFDYVFAHYQPILQRLESRTRNEDLAQELSIVLYNAMKSFDINGGAKFNTFFWKCAQNHIGCQKKKKQAYKRQTDTNSVSLQNEIENSENVDTFEKFLKDDNSEMDFKTLQFKLALDSLKPQLSNNEYYTILRLREGDTLHEIAEVLGVSAPAICSMLKRLRNKKEIADKIKQLLL